MKLSGIFIFIIIVLFLILALPLINGRNSINPDLLVYPCNNITGVGEQYFCSALVYNDENYCYNIEPSENRNICLALINKNVSFCEGITNPEYEKYCYYEFILLVNNITYCDELSNNVQCYWSFVNHLFWRGEIDLIEKEYCEMFPENDPDAHDCWAYYYNNVSLCGDDFTCLTCFEQPLSFCEGVIFESEADCIRDRALSSHNPLICDLINDSYMRDDCYMDYSNHVSSNDSLCEKIQNNDLKDMCYLEIAIRDYTNI